MKTDSPTTETPTFTPGPWDDCSNYPEFASVRIFAGSHYIASVGNSDDAKEQTEANARLIAAAPAMYEALEIQHACGEPEKASLYDEEGVEGWRWTHPDGREWTEIGDWSEPAPMHPVAFAALESARKGAR